MIGKYLIALSLLAPLAACGSSDGASVSCETATDCEGASVCVSRGDSRRCEITCSVGANECGGSAGCSGVGVLDVNVCSEPPPEGEAPAAEEQSRIACITDADCDALDAGTICVEWMGERDCTRPCTQESQCTTPSVGGITTDFLTCGDDEANSARKGCIPDERCLTNPASCVSFPSPF
jgi:hypothetical protein